MRPGSRRATPVKRRKYLSGDTSSALQLRRRVTEFSHEKQLVLVGETARRQRSNPAKPPMPIPAMFLAWVQHHQEAREIHRCACNFLSDRKLAKELGAPWVVAVTDW